MTLETYYVYYGKNKKPQKLELEPTVIYNANKGTIKSQNYIAVRYATIAGYSKYVEYAKLRILSEEEYSKKSGKKLQKKSTNSPPENNFSKRSVPSTARENILGACDRDWCNACRVGDYEKCKLR